MAVMFPTINNYKEMSEERRERLVRIFVQEKLDGCNFRCILHANGEVTFGSRRIHLRNEQDFRGMSRIKESLIKATLNLKRLVKQQSSDCSVELVVFGELIGRSDAGKLLVDRIDYLKDSSIRYYAYEILVKVDAYGGQSNDLIIYDKDVFVFKEINYAFLNFELAQEILKDAGFLVIPYEVRLPEIDRGQAILPPYKSLLFGHENENELEGYVLRFEWSSGRWSCAKNKSKRFLELENSGGGSRRTKKISDEVSVVNENSWKDFLSKYDFEEISNDNAEEILLEYADDLELERTKTNFTRLQNFIARKIPLTGSKTKLSIYSAKTLEKFMLPKTNVEYHEQTM